MERKENYIIQMNYFGNLNGINGVKTGFTNNAGRCLVCSCNRDGMNVISVVLGADTKKFRTKDSIQIIEYAYENYEQINLKEKVEKEFNNWQTNYSPSILKGEKQNFEVELEEIPRKMYSIKKGTEDLVEIQINADEFFEAPREVGTVIGSLNVSINMEKIYELEISNAEAVNKKNAWQYFREIMCKIKQ